MQPTASDITHAVMAGWKRERPVAALMGEFSSGKSTLLNFLLQTDVARIKVTATPMPPIWFTHSETPFTKGLTADGQEVDIDLADPDVDFRQEYLAVRRGMNCDILRDVDILDTPGLSDPNLRKDALRFLYRYLDFVVWCTSAAQAWRQTEKSAFERLATATRENSILLVTRFDKLRNDKDRDKVRKRVLAETGDLFRSVLPMKTTKAALVPLDQRTDDPTGAWVETGGFALQMALQNSISATVGSPEKLKPVATESPAPEVSAAPSTQAAGDDCGLIDCLKSAANLPNNRPYSERIVHLIAAIQSEESGAQPKNAALDSCIWIESDDLEMERVLSQIGKEINAFRDGPSLRLDT